MEEKNIVSSLGNKKTFTALAVLSSLLGLLFLVTTLLQKPPLPQEVFVFFQTSQGSFIFFATLSLVWSVITVPVIVAIAYLVKKGPNSGLRVSATLLTASGILLNGIISFIYVGALLSIWNTRNLPGATAEYDMTIWTNFFYFLSDPALMTWGLGQAIFGKVLLSNPLFPKWIGIITLIGGIAGMLTLVVYQTPVLAVLQAFTFIILTGYFSWFLLRRRNDRFLS